MCMGFGCNACGVTGCRIIDSPRERLIAILTNSFAPCNGRFPLLIFLCAVFFDAGSAGGALLLTGVIAGSVLLTLAASRLLSAFFLRGLPSSFVLELPPYRAPQPGRVIVRSVLDRTVFVLGRAMIVAAPAGALIWLLANITVSGSSLYSSMTAFLDPFARFFGLDGVILAAFLLVMVSPLKALIFLIFLAVLQQIEGNVIYPRVVGTSIGLPGIWVLTAVTVGGGLFGLPGVLLSVPVASVLYTLLKKDVRKRLSERHDL